jgi:hypothetical protein
MSLPVIGGNKFTADKGEKRSWIVCEGDVVGSGIKRIRDAMNEYGLRPPVIRTAETWFSITFRRKGPDEAVGSLSRKGIGEPARFTNRFIKRFTDHPRAGSPGDVVQLLTNPQESRYLGGNREQHIALFRG